MKDKNTKKNFVGYYRVSTEQQGQSGLGLTSQRDSVLSYINSNGTLTGEFTDVESGTSNNRAGLKGAILSCVNNNAILVVKELSRITRSGYKVIAELEELGIEYIESTSPFDSQLLKEIKLSLAKEERTKIASRTKDALEVIKRELKENGEYTTKKGRVITTLGKEGHLSDLGRQKSIQTRKDKARSNPNTIKARAFTEALLDNKVSYYQITKQLNKSGFKTPKGGTFSITQVRRLMMV